MHSKVLEKIYGDYGEDESEEEVKIIIAVPI